MKETLEKNHFTEKRRSWTVSMLPEPKQLNVEKKILMSRNNKYWTDPGEKHKEKEKVNCNTSGSELCECQ